MDVSVLFACFFVVVRGRRRRLFLGCSLVLCFLCAFFFMFLCWSVCVFFVGRRVGIFSCTPEHHIAFCPIFVHPLFPVFEPHIQKWFIFARRRPCVCDIFRFESPRLPGKKSILAPTPSSSSPRTTTIDLPECQERRAAKTTYSVCF